MNTRKVIGFSKKVAKKAVVETQNTLHTEIIIGVIGFVLSISLHEAFHLLLHWSQIEGVRFFPNFYTVAELVVNIPATYDLASEEFIAYAISAAILVMTAMIIGVVHDASDTRSAKQILFPQKNLVKGTVHSPPKKAKK